MTEDTLPRRASRRRTALGVLILFVPLFAVILWWAFTFRVGPVPPGGEPRLGTLPALAAVLASIFAAAGPALVLALFIANHRRLRTLFRPSRGKAIGAIVLALLTPYTVLNWVPWIFGGLILFGVGSGGGLLGVFAAVPALLVLSIAWYPVAALLVSGIRTKPLRVAAFALVFWSAYGILLLAAGYQEFML